MSGDTLSFRGVTMENTGVYQCNASNQFGYLLANAYVNVLREFPPPCLASHATVRALRVMHPSITTSNVNQRMR